MLKHFVTLFVAALSSLALVSSAGADVVIAPVSVTSPQGSPGGGYDLGNLINQSGMSSPYVSGVTEFVSYTSTATQTEDGSDIPSGFTDQSGRFPQSIVFTFQAQTLINGIAIWATDNGGSITQFSLVDAANNVILGLTNANPGNGTGTNPAQDFFFAPFVTSSVTMLIFNTAIGTDAEPGLGQVAFEATPVTDFLVPEASSLAVVAAALVSFFAFGFARRHVGA